MPAVTFPGFGFPVSSMPPVMQSLTYLNPLRHFLLILRSVYLKGVGLEVLWPQMLVLLLTAALVLTASCDSENPWTKATAMIPTGLSTMYQGDYFPPEHNFRKIEGTVGWRHDYPRPWGGHN